MTETIQEVLQRTTDKIIIYADGEQIQVASVRLYDNGQVVEVTAEADNV